MSGLGRCSACFTLCPSINYLPASHSSLLTSAAPSSAAATPRPEMFSHFFSPPCVRAARGKASCSCIGGINVASEGA